MNLSPSTAAPRPRPRAPASAPAPVRPWPRLLAHRQAGTLQVALEHSDRRLTHARTLPAGAGATLTDTLRAYLAGTGLQVAAGALVVDGTIASGRVRFDAATPPLGIEALRHALGLGVLHVIDEFEALRHGAGVPDGAELHWILPPHPASATAAVLCRLGSGDGGATLAALGADAPPPHASLMRYPIAVQDEDEHLVAAFLRSRGVAPLFGTLLGSAGLTLAFEALAGLADDWPGPLPAAAIASLAESDDTARRACAVVCGAIAQLCALLAPALRRYPLAVRLAGLAEQGGTAVADFSLGVAAAPIRYLDGARNALAHALRTTAHAAGEPIAERVRALYAGLTPSERRVADLVLADPPLATREPISAIARAAGVSQPQVIRFCRSLGFRGLTDFKLGLVASLARTTSAAAGAG